MKNEDVYGLQKTRPKYIHFWTNGEQFCAINIFFAASLNSFLKSHFITMALSIFVPVSYKPYLDPNKK